MVQSHSKLQVFLEAFEDVQGLLLDVVSLSGSLMSVSLGNRTQLSFLAKQYKILRVNKTGKGTLRIKNLT